MKVENAKITDVSISMADHGCLTFQIYLEGDGWVSAFGGYRIGNGYLGADKFTAKSGAGLVAMMKIMDAIGVERWEDLKGKYVRIASNIAIGNIIEDKWFNAKEFFDNYKDEKDEGLDS